MTQDELGFWEWAFKGMVGILFTVGGWLWVMLIRAVSKNHDDLSDHKLHVSEVYAKKTEIGDVFDCIDEIRKDIKTLLVRHQ